MKHKIRDSIIFCIHILGISFLYRVHMRSQGPLVRVVCFHDVTDRGWFEKVIDLFAKNYHILTPQQFHAHAFDGTKINILLTFDDGYQSWIDTCVPVLDMYGLKSLFFINSGLVDCAREEEKVAAYMRERLLISPKAPLTWEGARTLVAGGHTIGGHSASHLNLASLSIGDLEMEITDDKKRIEKMLDITVQDFAYPFGANRFFNPEVIAQVNKAGYSVQYSAISGFCINSHLNRIPRTLLEKSQDIRSIQYWIEGGYDIFFKLLTPNTYAYRGN